jgi:DNA-binding response OmpR family regulator
MTHPGSPIASPVRVLIAEDEAIVSYSVAEDLAEFGYAVIGPFATCVDALHWLETGTADLAVLDLMLKDGICTDLAHKLTDRGVPFLIFSGEMRDGTTPPAFEEAIWIEKPSSIDHLVESLQHLRAWPRTITAS